MNCEMCGLPLFSGASGYIGPTCKCGWREIHPINSVDSRNRIATLEAEVAALRAEVEGMREALDEYALGDERYKYVRRLNAMEFAKLYQRNIKEGIPFDDLIDLARKESRNG